MRRWKAILRLQTINKRFRDHATGIVLFADLTGKP
jgi:hypothetical protein